MLIHLMEDKYGCQNGKKILDSKTISPGNNLFLTIVNWPNKWNSYRKAEYQDPELHILVDIGLIFQTE